MLSNLEPNSFFYIAAYFVALEGLFGIPVLVFLFRKYSFEQTSDLFRMLHSIGFDFNEETKEEIKDARNSTEKAFFELRLYMHDGFIKQLKRLQKLKENDYKIHIQELIQQYESGTNKETDNNKL